MKKFLVILFILVTSCPISLLAKANKTVSECSLYITSKPKGATIFLGNAKKGTAPLYLEGLPYGQVTLYACLEGYSTKKRVVQCRARRGQKVNFLLNKLGRLGRLYVQTTPEDAEVRVMNILMDFHNGMRLSPGEYRVEVAHPGYNTVERLAEVRANQNSTLRVKLAKNVGRLFVHPTPEDAKVRIMNIMPPYRPGIELSPDNYRINVSKRGYRTKEKWISLDQGEEKHVSIALKSGNNTEKAQKAVLVVHPHPEDARVRIMNIVPPYHPKIKLDPGEYRINVSSQGYRTKEVTIFLSAGEKREMDISLDRKEVQGETLDQKDIEKSPDRKEEGGQKGRLYVRTEPEGARVRILNIQRPFVNGMELDPGRYKIFVDKKGYTKKERWVRIPKNEAEEILVNLEKKRQEIKTWTENLTDMEFVHVPGGFFIMGCDSWVKMCDKDEMPAHKVYVDGFWIGRYEVTQRQWNEVMKKNPSQFKKGGNYPVEQVSWYEAKTFIKKLNQKYDGRMEFRLPTEEEWEYAARSGGKPELYSGGDIPDEVAWYQNNSNGTIHPVGSRKPNGLGLYDMSGNVWEWCQEVYSKTAYSRGSNNDYDQNEGNKPEIVERVRRGGSWAFGKKKIRTTYRGKYPQDLGLLSLGLRIVREDKD